MTKDRPKFNTTRNSRQKHKGERQEHEVYKTKVKINFYYVKIRKHEHEKTKTRVWFEIVPSTNVEQIECNGGPTFIYTPLRT